MSQAWMVDRSIRGRSVLVRRAAVLLVLLALVGAALLAYGHGTFSDRVAVSARVDDAGGSLSAGSDVKMRGVIVGRVTSIATDRGTPDVRIGLSIDGAAAARIPSDVEASVLPATVFGTTFVDLTEASNAATSATGLRDGQVIGQDRSRRTVELQDALDSADRVLTAVEPAKLATTLSNVAGALRGRGDDLGRTFETLDGYLARLEPHLPLLKEDLRLAAVDLQVLAEASPDLLAATQAGLTTTRTVVAKRRELRATLTGARHLVTTADGFLRAQQEHIIDTLANAATTFDSLYAERRGLAGGFRAFVTFAKKASQGFSDGSFLQTNVFIKTGGDVPYTAADCPRFGSAVGDNCTDGRSSDPGASDPGAGDRSGAPTPSERPSAEPDTDLLGQISGLLSDLGSGR